MKKYFLPLHLLPAILLMAALIIAGCPAEPEQSGDIEVSFSALIQNGWDMRTTSVLTLAFDKDIEGLTAEDIAINAGTTGVTRETLSRRGLGVYELEVSGITESGIITVTVSKAEYIISPDSLDTTIYYYTGNTLDDET
ncbi:MAG: hypothetical protein LBS48_02580 [Treponema sp.]|nr:hypothetical protein [Treponema sp.]